MRATLFGIDAYTFSDRQEDVDVRVRMDTAMRRDLGAVENMWLMTPAGRAVPLSQVADIKAATTYATIKRVDRQRSVTVTADTVPSVSPEDISNALDERLDAIRAGPSSGENCLCGSARTKWAMLLQVCPWACLRRV